MTNQPNSSPTVCRERWHSHRHLARDGIEEGLRLVIARERLQRITSHLRSFRHCRIDCFASEDDSILFLVVPALSLRSQYWPSSPSAATAVLSNLEDMSQGPQSKTWKPWDSSGKDQASGFNTLYTFQVHHTPNHTLFREAYSALECSQLKARTHKL